MGAQGIGPSGERRQHKGTPRAHQDNVLAIDGGIINLVSSHSAVGPITGISKVGVHVALGRVAIALISRHEFQDRLFVLRRLEDALQGGIRTLSKKSPENVITSRG